MKTELTYQEKLIKSYENPLLSPNLSEQERVLFYAYKEPTAWDTWKERIGTFFGYVIGLPIMALILAAIAYGIISHWKEIASIVGVGIVFLVIGGSIWNYFKMWSWKGWKEAVALFGFTIPLIYLWLYTSGCVNRAIPQEWSDVVNHTFMTTNQIQKEAKVRLHSRIYSREEDAKFLLQAEEQDGVMYGEISDGDPGELHLSKDEIKKMWDKWKKDYEDLKPELDLAALRKEVQEELE